jgi:hypothetical protein
MIEPPIMLPIVTGSRLLCVDEAQAITYGRYRRVTRRAYNATIDLVMRPPRVAQ